MLGDVQLASWYFFMFRTPQQRISIPVRTITGRMPRMEGGERGGGDVGVEG